MGTFEEAGQVLADVKSQLPALRPRSLRDPWNPSVSKAINQKQEVQGTGGLISLNTTLPIALQQFLNVPNWVEEAHFRHMAILMARSRWKQLLQVIRRADVSTVERGLRWHLAVSWR